VLVAKLGLQPRGTIDWLDALVSLGMLERSGDVYANTGTTGLFLDRAKPTYLGGMLEMANTRLRPPGRGDVDPGAGRPASRALAHGPAGTG